MDEKNILGLKDNSKRMEACQMAHAIIDLDEQLDEIYNKREFYKINGHLPYEVEPEIIGDPVRWATELKNAERYVRDYRIKVKKDPANEKWAAKLRKYEADVMRYKKLLKLD